MLARLRALLRYGVCGGFVVMAGLALAVSALRIPYPFELEWLEGGSLLQVQRLLAGEGLYVEPSFRFVAHPYGPVYYGLAALVAAATGLAFWPLRLVSYLATLGSLVAIVATVRSRAGRLDAAIVAAATFAATYALSGTWFEVARVDSLFLCLLLAASYLLVARESTAAAAAAGALLALSYLTKQLALVAAMPLLLWTLVDRWRRGLACVATAGAVTAVASLLLERASGGWYWYHTVTLGARHPLLKGSAPRVTLDFLVRDLLRPLPVVCALVLLWAAAALASRDRRRAAPMVALAAGLVATGWVGRLNSGFDNVLLPAHAGLALLLGMALGRALDLPAAGAGRRREAAAMATLLLLGGQLVLLRFDPRRCLPTAADRAAGEELVARLRSMDGEVVVSAHPYLLALAGKPTHAHQVAITELIGGFGGEADDHGRRLLAGLAEDVGRRRFSAIILDGPRKPGATDWFVPLEGTYRSGGSLLDDPEVFMPVTGAPRQPRFLLVPVR